MMIAERVLDVVTLLSIFALLAFVALRGIDTPATGAFPVAAGGVAVAVLAGAVALAFFRDHPKVAAALAFVAPMSVATRNLRGRHGAVMLVTTLCIWAFEAATWFAVGQVTGLHMEPVEALYLLTLASVFVLVPSGPGYAGTLDAAVLFGVGAIGASSRAAVSYLITLRFILMVPITICGVVLLVSRYGGWGQVFNDDKVGRR